MTELRLPGTNKIGMSIHWDMTISTKNRPKVMVVSHERSGTHFLMNTIALNFGYVSDPWIDIDHNTVVNPWAYENILFLINQAMGKNVVNTFKSHHAVEFFLPILDRILEEFVIFYIWRADKDKLFESVRKHFNDFPWHCGPKCESGYELQLSAPSGACTRYQVHAHENMLERWNAHVKGWTKLEREHKNVVLIQYEVLDKHFEREVIKIGRYLVDLPPSPPIRPPRNVNVITPEEVERRMGR